MVLLATPILPAKTPCKRRIDIASFNDRDVPKIVQVIALPKSDTNSTVLGPCRSATVA